PAPSALSLHDALPISAARVDGPRPRTRPRHAGDPGARARGIAAPDALLVRAPRRAAPAPERRAHVQPVRGGARDRRRYDAAHRRSEEHTSELQSLAYL